MSNRRFTFAKNFEAVSPFYEQPSNIGKTKSGELLRAEPLASKDLLPGAAAGKLLLYSSTGARGQRIAVSGFVMVPDGPAPKKGWPVISYAHGTVGIVSHAAPSLNPNAKYIDTYGVFGELPPFLAEGYAIVCTDFEGLGTAGPHPYLNGLMQAHCQIDIVRAAREAAPELSSSWIGMGQSQGGQTTVFTAAYATEFGPDLDYRGGVATTPPTHFHTLVAASGLGRVLIPLILHAVSYFDDSINPRDYLNADGLNLLRLWETHPLTDPPIIMSAFHDLGDRSVMTEGAFLKDGAVFSADKRLSDALFALNPLIIRSDRPLFLAQGAKDDIVIPGLIRMLGDELSAIGSDITFRSYAGADHFETPMHALPDTIPFVAGLFK